MACVADKPLSLFSRHFILIVGKDHLIPTVNHSFVRFFFSIFSYNWFILFSVKLCIIISSQINPNRFDWKCSIGLHFIVAETFGAPEFEEPYLHTLFIFYCLSRFCPFSNFDCAITKTQYSMSGPISSQIGPAKKTLNDVEGDSQMHIAERRPDNSPINEWSQWIQRLKNDKLRLENAIVCIDTLITLDGPNVASGRGGKSSRRKIV